jgi:TonB family protein
VILRTAAPTRPPSLSPRRFAMAALALLHERRLMAGSNRKRLFKSLLVTVTIFGLLFAIALFLIPAGTEIVRVDMPERQPMIQLQDIVAKPPPPLTHESENVISRVAVHQGIEEPVQPAEPEPLPRTRQAEARHLAPDAGQVGRARAVAELKGATQALDGALADLNSSLHQSNDGAYTPARGRRGRTVRSGRADGELAGIDAGRASSGAANDLGSSVKGSLVAIGAVSSSPVHASGSEGGRSSGSDPGIYRSNAELLAVIQRYAAGIQYCYSSELKRDDSLRGKLVVAMTVAASGKVIDATVVQNTVGSERLAACALAQIREWRFPAIPEGITTFQTPFVFTPPN